MSTSPNVYPKTTQKGNSHVLTYFGVCILRIGYVGSNRRANNLIRNTKEQNPPNGQLRKEGL
jgi:hypothetical protein